MLKSMLLAGAVLMMAQPVHAQSQAQSRCNRPYAPTVNITAASTAAQVERIGADVRAFSAASDIFQTCLMSQTGRPDTSRLVQASQDEKVRVVAAYYAALRSRRSGRSLSERSAVG